MNLIELIYFMIMLGAGVWVGKLLYPVGGWWLAIPGFVAGFVLLPGLMIAYVKYRKWAYCGDHFMPSCVCGGRKFKGEKVGDDLRLVCRACGKQYDRLRDRVFTIEEGKRVPYMHLVKHQGWVEWKTGQR